MPRLPYAAPEREHPAFGAGTVIHGAFERWPQPFTYHDILERWQMREHLEGMARTSRCLDCGGTFASPEAATQHAHMAGHAVRLETTTSRVVGSLDSLCRVVI